MQAIYGANLVPSVSPLPSPGDPGKEAGVVPRSRFLKRTKHCNLRQEYK